jgi:hypothetical protein
MGYFQAHLAHTMAAFNMWLNWFSVQHDAVGFVHLTSAEFSL